MSQDYARPLRIFLAEDSRADACLVEMALQEHTTPYTMRLVTNGEDAIDAVTRFGNGEEQPDIALLDLNLPRQGGDKVIRSFRNQPGCETTPVVLMTSTETERERALATEFDAAFFSKPADLAEFMQLGALVKSLLDSQSDRRRKLSFV
jgi:CheY-like chemotaxis protein